MTLDLNDIIDTAIAAQDNDSSDELAQYAADLEELV